MKALEIFIGLFFVYLVLSTLVTAVSEVLISYFNVRARVLRESVRRMLGGNEELEDAFFNAAEIKSLIDAKRLDRLSGKAGQKDAAAPSYLEGDTFARNLLNLFDSETRPILTLDRFYDTIQQWKSDEAAHGDGSQRQQLVEVLQGRIDTAIALQKKRPLLDDRESLILSIKEWYDDSMERSRGIYRRRTRKYVVICAAVITLALNADTIRIVRALSADEAALAKVVEAASKQVNETVESIPVAAKDDTDKATADQIEKDAELQKQIKGLRGAVKELENASFELEEAGIPLGWGGELQKHGWVYFILKIFGLMATIIAATLGAPFWYDILNKLSNLRSSAGLKSKPVPTDETQDSSASVATVESREGAVKPARSLKLAFSDQEECFDIDRAYWLGRCSEVSYLSFDKIKSTVAEWGLRDEVVTIGDEIGDASKGTQAFIACNSDCVVIAFRGTEKKSDDILTDIDLGQDIWEIENDSGQYQFSIHGGFLKGYLSVQQQVVDTLKRCLQQNPQRSIWLTGHSLGGALATVCLADLLTRKIPVSGLYTYGSPRVGNRQFVDYLNMGAKEHIFRFVNQDDPVTEVPLEVIQGYCHVGNLRYFDRFNRLKEDAATWKRVLRKTAFWLDLKYDSDSKNEAMNMLKSEFKQRGSYHSIVNYIEKIAAHSGHRRI